MRKFFSFLAGVLAGAVVGAAAAILLAPYSGSELQDQIRSRAQALVEEGKRVAIWGGTGKAAALISQYELDAERFPIVVDSDVEKSGTFVPGTGQEIRFRDYLLKHPVDVILIATQWRAVDIAAEIDRCAIPFESILIEHEGQLIDFLDNEHPYRDRSMRLAPHLWGGKFPMADPGQVTSEK